jgi:hypothetical protein
MTADLLILLVPRAGIEPARDIVPRDFKPESNYNIKPMISRRKLISLALIVAVILGKIGRF